MANPGYRMKNPVHRRGFIRREIIEPLELAVTSAAKVLDVSRQSLSTLLNEGAVLSPDMALRIEKAFGVSMDTLMRMQNSLTSLRPAAARAKSRSIAPSRRRRIRPSRNWLEHGGFR